MSPFYDHVFKLRLVFIALAVGAVVSLAWPRVRRALLESFKPSSSKTDPRASRRGLIVFACGYFALAALCKYTQLQARLLNGEDFWLFDDLLRWMSRGETYITRFAGHAAGPIQHGGVHAYLSLWAAVPFTYVFGSTCVALLLSPVAFALGGYAIGAAVSQFTTSRFLIFGLPLAFWMSEWTNRTLLYDTHPEAFYVPLVFFVYFASLKLYERESTKHWVLFLTSWTLLSGMKQDALVYGLLLWAFLIIEKRLRPLAAAISLTLVIGLFVAMTELISLFKSGVIGPSSITLLGTNVPLTRVTTGAVNLNGAALSGFPAVLSMISMFMKEGLPVFFMRGFKYLFASQFTLLTLIAPWLWLRRSFWLLVVPFALLVGGMNTPMAQLQVYNSVAFVSLLWLCLCIEAGRWNFDRRYLLAGFVWTFAFCGLHGASSPEFYFESELSRQTSREARELSSHQAGLGIVSSRLLRDVDESHVWADRVATPGAPLASPPRFVSFVLFPKTGASFEFAQSDFAKWEEWATSQDGWQLVSGQTVDLLIRH